MKVHMAMIIKLFALVIAALLVATAPACADFRFPAGSGVVNVRDYGAKGDGKTDDTAAINKAIAENIEKHRYRSNPFIYFPRGTYLVSGPIEGRVIKPGREEGKVWSAGWMSMMSLMGESREGTIIKLVDNAEGYGDPANPKWLVATGSESDKNTNYKGGGNRAFRHCITNLTVDVGNGNPGAIGIDFIASNRGTVDGVTIRAGAGSGHTGLALTRNWPGPALIYDVLIDGFARGIELGHFQYGMTFENIQMRGQREVGVKNRHNVVAMRRVNFTGSVPFYNATGRSGMLCLMDSSIQGTGAAANASAIESESLANLRRVTFTGFGKAFDDTGASNKDIAAEAGKPTVVRSYDQGFTLCASGGEPEGLDLPIEDVPTVRPGPDDEWTDAGDSGESLQKAIDSGAEWIYVKPRGALEITNTVILRGKAKLIYGLNGHIKSPPGVPAFRVDEGSSPVVVLENIYIEGDVEHPSRRTFVLRHGDFHVNGIKATGPGKTHIVDVIGKGYQIGPQHTLWARQLNAEFGEAPLFTNHGTSWILGFKMETSPRGSKDAPNSTPSILNKAGRLELLGGLLYTLGEKKEQAPLVPAFTNESGSIAISYRTNGKPETYYRTILRMGSFEGGEDLPASQIKGPGAALLTDKR